MEDSYSLPHAHNANAHVTSAPEFVPEGVGGGGNGGGGSAHSARYRLMSPAKLPISRSSCITVPTGLSPTSFLESPVLLSNIKAEPSPTTGSFLKPQFMQGPSEVKSLPVETLRTSWNTVGEATSNSFEFNFHNGATSRSIGLTVPVGLNRNGPVIHQDQCRSQYPTLPSISGIVDELDQAGPSTTGILASSSDHKDASDDGYNWRKYGQKLVKGSEFPRSYYKCTHPNCEVKKIFERSPSGLVKEIVYKGSHDHPKPQALRRHNSAALMSIQEDKLEHDFSFTRQEDNLNTNNMEPNASPVLSPLEANEDGVDGASSYLQRINDDTDENDPKRRRTEDGFDVTSVVKPIREPRVVVQTVSEVDILDDGYRWRKYGQKVVRGNPNPRSYYKCTSVGCPVRKHVERASHDPKAVITTYEGKHNHDVPAAKNSSHDFSGAPYSNSNYIASLNIRPVESYSSSITLDLGVGNIHTNP